MIKTVSVCDHCGAEAPVQVEARRHCPPAGWFGVIKYGIGVPSEPDPGIFSEYCSPACVAAALSVPRMEREATA